MFIYDHYTSLSSAATPTSHSVHASDTDQAGGPFDSMGSQAHLSVSILPYRSQFSLFFRHNHITLIRLTLDYTCQVHTVNEVVNALKLGQQCIGTQSSSQDSCDYKGDCTSLPQMKRTLHHPGDPTLDGESLECSKTPLSCGMLYAIGVVCLL
jgi:hypothetical protein